MIVRLCIAMVLLLVGGYSPTYNKIPQPLSTTTTTENTNAIRTLELSAPTTTTTTVVGTTTTTEPNEWDIDWLATLETPTDEYWDTVAQCETAGEWTNGGQWAGGLGIFVATWRGFGGAEFAPTPDKATRAEQIIVANRIALHGYQNASGAIQQPVGFKGWGCIRNNKYLEPTVPTTWEAWRNK